MEKEEVKRKVWAFIEEHKMLTPGDRVIVALSGGVDSVCLLLVLEEFAREWEVCGKSGQKGKADFPALEIRAVHVNHGLRGLEAKRDEEFVRVLCGRLGIALEVMCRDVAGYARKRGISEEEAGRIVRYHALEDAAKRWGERCRPVWIGVAHHQDDQAETILHHLMRGSGLKGLAGIQPVQGKKIRPLLCVRRQEIQEYVRARGISWCEDSSNRSETYTRNRIRRVLIPYLTEQVNSRAVENILHAGEIFRQADQYLAAQADIVWQQAGRTQKESEEKDVVLKANLDVGMFLQQAPIIQSYLIRHMIEILLPGQKNITAKHFRQVQDLACKPSGSRCDLPGGMRAIRRYGEISIEYLNVSQDISREKTSRPNIVSEFLLPSPEEGVFLAENMELRAFFRKKETKIPKKQYTKWFDYDKIKGMLSVRTRRPGDFLTLPGGGRKKLNRFLIDEKIPREQRDEILVLAEGNQVLWVVGYRISEYYKITDETHMVLQIGRAHV